MTIPEAAYDADAMGRLLRERRTVHDFRAEPVPESILAHALEALRWAPNHYLSEPWRLYHLGERPRTAIAELNAQNVRATRGERAAEVKRARWLAMPGWLVINCVRDQNALREREDYAACCCAAQNFMLSLWSHGVGVKWTTGDVVRDPEFARIVGFDTAAESVVGLFWYGWPAQIGVQKRRPLADILTRVE